jgi:hypothetical protein
VSAFGRAADVLEYPRVWCNLCRAEGKTFEVLDPAADGLAIMDAHTRLEHPEHVAALKRGEAYIPVEVDA